MACAHHPGKPHAALRALLPPPCTPAGERTGGEAGRTRKAKGKVEGKVEAKVEAKAKAKGKEAIPKALREQVWLAHAGRVFDAPCAVPWCTNPLTVYDFHVGHDEPESRGGCLDLANLRPLCARCNLSMGDRYTIREWSALAAPFTPVVVPECVPAAPLPAARPKRRWWGSLCVPAGPA